MSGIRSKLAVILHADVVGSTMLVQADEHIAHARIRDAFAQASRLVAVYAGTVLEVRGDALVAEFQRASDAVVAALAIQEENSEAVALLDDDIKPLMRIGIALGEVVIADGTVTGEGVVLAQRLEQEARPGEVCVQGSVHDSVPTRMPLDYRDLGEKKLKGFARAIRAYIAIVRPGENIPAPIPITQSETSHPISKRRIPIVLAVLVSAAVAALLFFKPWDQGEQAVTSLPASGATQVAIENGTESEEASIAVLAFNNTSGDPEQDYFADGISEDIITDISRLDNLLVIARNTSFSYKSKVVPIKTIGKELNVRYVLEGSVRRAGNELRINAQLIDTVDESHVWAKRFDGSLDDVFGFQDAVTERVVAALQAEFSGVDLGSNTSGSSSVVTENVEAYDAFLLGMRNLNEARHMTGLDAYIAARTAFDRAISLDPSYAVAYAGLGWVNWIAANFGFDYSPVKHRATAWRLAEKSIALQDNALAHRLLSKRYLDPEQFGETFGDEIVDHEKALTEARRAELLEPNNADVLAELAQVLVFSGEVDQARAKLNRAKRLNPNYPNWYTDVDAIIEFLSGNYPRSTQLFELAANGVWQEHTTWWHASALGHAGRIDDAKRALSPPNPVSGGSYPTTQFAISRSIPLKVAAHKDRFLKGLDKV